MSDKGYTATIDTEAPDSANPFLDDSIDQLVDALAEHSGAVSAGQDGRSYGATFSIDEATSVANAFELAGQVMETAVEHSGLPDWPVVNLQIQTYDVQDRELDEPTIPELVGITEIAETLDVSRQRAHALSKSERFPEPVARLASGPVWTRPSLDRFVDEYRSGAPTPVDVTETLELIKGYVEVLNEYVRRALAQQAEHGPDTEALGRRLRRVAQELVETRDEAIQERPDIAAALMFDNGDVAKIMRAEMKRREPAPS